MSSLVIELQEKAVNNNSDISTLLRTAFLVARKLDLEKIEEWIGKELSGYSQGDILPSYRKITGAIGYRAFTNTVWVPSDLTKLNMTIGNLNKNDIRDSIGYLETTVERSPDVLYYAFTPNDTMSLRRNDSSPVHSDPLYSLRVNTTDVKNIFTQVRNRILDWSLELEKAEIYGSGMTFSPKEKENSKVVNWTINNIFQGDIGNSQIQQGTQDSLQSFTNNDLNFELDKILYAVDSFKSDTFIADDDRLVLEEAIRALEEERGNEQPDRSKISRAINTIKKIALSASGGAAGNLLLDALSNLPI